MNWLAWASGALKINRLVKLIPELRTLLEFEAVEEGNDDLQEEAVSALHFFHMLKDDLANLESLPGICGYSWKSCGHPDHANCVYARACFDAPLDEVPTNLHDCFRPSRRDDVIFLLGIDLTHKSTLECQVFSQGASDFNPFAPLATPLANTGKLSGTHDLVAVSPKSDTSPPLALSSPSSPIMSEIPSISSSSSPDDKSEGANVYLETIGTPLLKYSTSEFVMLIQIWKGWMPMDG